MNVRFTLCLVVALMMTGTAPAWASFAGTDVYLPSVGRGPGAMQSDWFTTVWIHNTTPQDAQLQVRLLERGASNPSPAVHNDVIPGGETVMIPNVIETLFGLPNRFGALRITSDRKLVVNSRIYSVPAGGDESDSTGQFFSAVPAAFAIELGETTKLLGVFQTEPQASSPFRYNFGFVESAGGNATVEVRAYDGINPGIVVASRQYTVGPYGAQQHNVADLGLVDGANLHLEVEVISGGGAVIPFGSALANSSNDPSTFEMAYDQSLLGGSSAAVQHDGSLTGDGTAGSPLGIATSGVETVHLGTANSPSGGDALTYSAGGLRWQAVSGGGGLALPYDGTGSSATPAFQVSNGGTGAGIRGHSVGGFGGVFGADNDHYDLVLAGAVGRINTDPADESSELYLSSNADIILKIDNDGGEEHELRIKNSGGRDLCTVNEAGSLMCVDETGNGTGVSGIAPSGQNSWGVNGESVEGIGVRGRSENGYGVYGVSLGGAAVDSVGVAGESTAVNGTGVYGRADAGVTSYGVWGRSASGFAGNFTGNVAVSGGLDVQGSKNFRIDHPLAPASRWLYHAAVESDEVLNQYSGTVVLDADGAATVLLPAWFGAVNSDVRYQLTPIGAPAPSLHVAEEIAGNRFGIAGGPAGCKVSWQITARRSDPFLEAHPFAAERDKPEELIGTYLSPELYGQPEELGMEWKLHPEVMRADRDDDVPPRQTSAVAR